MVPNFQPNLFRRHTEPLDLFCWAMLLLVMLLVCPLSLSSPLPHLSRKRVGERYIGVTLGPGGSGFGTLFFSSSRFSSASLPRCDLFFAFTILEFFSFFIISSSLISLLIKSRTYLHTTLAGFFFYNGLCMECLLINPKLVFTFFLHSRKVNSCFCI
uniref:(northern house mosquito) hypothetical protein n=1 Tax=Culex pipiens TaxID=7175 RepID=A0A8D8F369_CULPI